MKNKSLPDLIRTGFIKTSSETTEESSVTGHMKDGKKPVKAVP
jgi:hypothetical protein